MKNNTREIKFRVWDFIGEKWADIFSVDLVDECYLNNLEYGIQQFVGIRDKNSKEIYEGDIITCSFFYSPETTITGVVEFSLETLNYVIRYNTVPDQEDGSGFTSQESLEDLHMVSGIEIIGNVFENGDITPGAARPC